LDYQIFVQFPLLSAIEASIVYKSNLLSPNLMTFSLHLQLKISIHTQSDQDQRDLCDSKAINTTIGSVRIYAHPDIKIYQDDTLALDLCVQDWNAEISIAYTYTRKVTQVPGV
jgi:hypothetical protein